jgi:selenocysteine lyase/cysteine desulfurase
MNRRQLLSGAAAATVAPDFARVRADFPAAARQVYLNPAGYCPLGLPMARAMERYAASQVGGGESGEALIAESKRLFGQLARARPEEIAVIPSTLAGENIVAAGLGLHDGRGNVVTDELHYHGGLYLYRSLQKSGLDVRVVKPRDWRVRPQDIDAAVDKNTRLVAVTLVSNINGFEHDAAKLASIAHASGARLYADVVQAAGCVPLDLAGSGIDFAAASGYKWLMGLRGFGFLYVRRELQGSVLRQTQYGDRQYTDFDYPYSLRAFDDARRYEVGNVSEVGAAVAVESLRYILGLGVDRMVEHSLPLARRVRAEVEALGHRCITPRESRAPMAAFALERPEEVATRLRKAGVVAKVKWRQLRVSMAAFNNGSDVDRLLNALS